MNTTVIAKSTSLIKGKTVGLALAKSGTAWCRAAGRICRYGMADTILVGPGYRAAFFDRNTGRREGETGNIDVGCAG